MAINELAFQRKKESSSSYASQPSNDSTKNIYDYILKQDTKIQILEKEMQLMKGDLALLHQRDSDGEVEGKKGGSAIDCIKSLNNNTEANKQIKEIIADIICTEDYISPSLLQLKNCFIDMQSQSEEVYNTFEKRFSIIEERVNTINNNSNSNSRLKEDKESTISNSNSNYIDLITKNAERHELLIDNVKSDLTLKVKAIHKRLDDFDQDFDRLINSLKTQFQTVNEMISQNKQYSTKDLVIKGKNTLNPEVIDNIFTTINQLKEKNQRNENIIASLSQVKKDSIEKDTISNMMANEVISLRKEIHSDFELINSKILDELQSQANDISELYTLIDNNKLIRCNSNSKSNSNEVSESIALLEQELDKKANIEQVNNTLESQSKINEAFFLAYRVGRWSWSHGAIDDKGMIIWSLQNINTALDHFAWNNDNGSIAIKTKGIYEITTGLLSSTNDASIGIYINDIEIKNSNDSNQHYIKSSSIVLLNEYIALREGSVLQINLSWEKSNSNNNDFRDQFNTLNAESFFEIRKVL